MSKTAMTSSKRCSVEQPLIGYDKTRFLRNVSAAPTFIRGNSTAPNW